MLTLHAPTHATETPPFGCQSSATRARANRDSRGDCSIGSTTTGTRSGPASPTAPTCATQTGHGPGEALLRHRHTPCQARTRHGPQARPRLAARASLDEAKRTSGVRRGGAAEAVHACGHTRRGGGSQNASSRARSLQAGPRPRLARRGPRRAATGTAPHGGHPAIPHRPLGPARAGRRVARCTHTRRRPSEPSGSAQESAARGQRPCAECRMALDYCI